MSNPAINLVELPPIHPWEALLLERGLCRQRPDLPWTRNFDQSIPGIHQMWREMELVCAACPVAYECRVVADHVEVAARNPQECGGFWAGETGPQRFVRRKARRNMKAKRWRCRKCGATYESPIALSAVSCNGKCNKRLKDRQIPVEMDPVTEEAA